MPEQIKSSLNGRLITRTFCEAALVNIQIVGIVESLSSVHLKLSPQMPACRVNSVK